MNTVAESRLKRPGSLEKNPKLAQWLRVHRDGTVSIFSGKVEIGQGISTALAQIAAEELGVTLERIRMVAADTAVSPDEGVTSGSLSIQDSGVALRRACAQARTLLLKSAAARLGVSVRDLQVADGTARTAGRSTSFWECADDALFDCKVDETAALRSPRDYQVVGKPAPRRDLPDKIAGRPRFIQDITLPGMLYGRMVRPPYNFAGPVSLDDSKVKSMPGLAAIVRDGGFVGVLAEREDVAISAQRALRVTASWREVDALPRDVHAWLKEHAAEHRVISEKENADAKSRAAKVLEASYTKPYISHASIGPSCAIARIDDDKLTVWSHSQGIFNLRRDLALVLGMREDAIVVRHAEGAGCSGHNGADDAALDAALLARAAGGRPVQVQWMRDDEFAWAPCGPAMALSLRAALDSHGDIVDWKHELWSNGHSSRPGRADNPALLAAWHLSRAYERPSAINMPLPAGAADRNAEGSKWNPAESRGHGIGFARYKNLGAYCAAVAEVEVGHDVRVNRLILAVDVGLVINPDGVINQIEGGAIQSTSWTLREQVRLGARGIASLGWEDYPILKFSEVPVVEVELLDRPELPAVGAGEAAQGPAAAAIANAVAHALGLRGRDLPLAHERIAAAISQST